MALYAGFAQALRYPADGDGVLTGSQFLRAFDPAVSREAASLHEHSYAQVDVGALFEEPVRHYDHFGLKRRGDAGRPDHVVVELEFMHFLCAMEKAMGARGAATEDIRRAEADFLERHLRPLLSGVSRSARGDDQLPRQLVGACLEFVDEHLAALARTTASPGSRCDAAGKP